MQRFSVTIDELCGSAQAVVALMAIPEPWVLQLTTEWQLCTFNILMLGWCMKGLLSL